MTLVALRGEDDESEVWSPKNLKSHALYWRFERLKEAQEALDNIWRASQRLSDVLTASDLGLRLNILNYQL